MSDRPRTALKLHADTFWISPYVFSCFVTLREKGLPFEVVTVALERHAQHDPAYRDRSITGRVPALDDGGFWLAESHAIVEYLDDAYPDTPRALPAGVRDRARARQILGWIRSDLLALREARPTTSMFYEHLAGPLPEAARAAADKLLRVAGLLVPAGATSLFGAWSVADADLAFMLHRLLLNGEEVPPGLRAFAEAQWARPSVRAFVEHPRPAYVPYG
jgi:glutathione S-transferase